MRISCLMERNPHNVKPAPMISRPWICSTFRQLATKDKELQNEDMLSMIPFATHIYQHTKCGNLMNPTSQKPFLPNLSNQWHTHRGFDFTNLHRHNTKGIKSLDIHGQMWQITRARPSGGKIGKGPHSLHHHNFSGNGLDQIRLNQLQKLAVLPSILTLITKEFFENAL